jgi:DNA-binding Lrp family transcriptional regulator
LVCKTRTKRTTGLQLYKKKRKQFGMEFIHGTFGAYDILAKIESSTVETLRETITWKIRKIEKIRSTLTLMGIEGQT